MDKTKSAIFVAMQAAAKLKEVDLNWLEDETEFTFFQYNVRYKIMTKLNAIHELPEGEKHWKVIESGQVLLGMLAHPEQIHKT